ncbi:MAG: hypothetical protein EOP10_02050 [Proteobacteria bacterium]|nr:MAG: hypothetical protein EOP10_02050 [Pseudomonadota bacterium]
MLRLLIIFMTAFLGLNAWASSPVFKVTKKQGKIFVKGPMELAWHPLRSRDVEFGTIMRVDPLSSVELTIQGDNPDLPKTKIRINQPLITRLDEDLVRRTGLKDYPLKGLWDTGAESAKMNKDYPMLSFASAFVRSILTLDKVPKLPDVPYKDDPQGVESSSDIQKIKILSPSDQGLFFLSSGSATIPLVWNAPADNMNYRIYIWDVRDARTRPYATTGESWYQISVDKVGTYKIQVEDEKHRFRSDAITITVDRPMSDITSSEKNAPDRPLVDITLLSPYARSTQIIKRGSVTQFFSWEDKVPLEKNQFYRLILSKKDGKTKRIKTSELSAQVELEPGSYTWIVQKMSSLREKNPKSSDPRSLDIALATESLSKIIKRAPAQTLYIDLK